MLLSDLAQDKLFDALSNEFRGKLTAATPTNVTVTYTNDAVTLANAGSGATLNVNIASTDNSVTDTVTKAITLADGTKTSGGTPSGSGAVSNDAPSTSNNADEHTPDEGTAPQADDIKMEEAPLPKEESQPETQQESQLPKEEEKTTTTRRRRR